MEFIKPFEKYVLIKEQKDDKVVWEKKFTFKDVFLPGKTELSPTIKQKLKNGFNEMFSVLQKNSKGQAQVFITGSESQVPQDQEKGTLAKARAQAVKTYIENTWPNFISKLSIRTKEVIGNTPWNPDAGDKRDDQKFIDEQFVNIQARVVIIEYPSFWSQIANQKIIKEIEERPNAQINNKAPWDALSSLFVKHKAIDPKYQPEISKFLKERYYKDGTSNTLNRVLAKEGDIEKLTTFKHDAMLLPPNVHKEYTSKSTGAKWLYDSLSKK